MDDKGWNMFVFRDGSRFVPGASLRDGLAYALQQAAPAPDADYLLDLLMRAGELECALADAASPALDRAATVTDVLAAALLTPGGRLPSASLLSIVQTLAVPERARVSPPEGFAYYGLHPLDYSRLLEKVPLHSRFAAVAGIRSIGTTLSAIVAATLRRRGVRTARITVRPAGHPYDRRTSLSSQELRFTAVQRARRADFFVVDEGPGMSGSSFLSVGDALLQAGVPRRSITFLCSRVPDAATLRAPDALHRWPGFQSHCVDQHHDVPREAAIYIGGGEWRRHFFSAEPHWPASWIQMERLKFLSSDRTQFFKFEGHGRFGAELYERARVLGDAGFSPRPLGLSQGFGCYPVLSGESLGLENVSPPILERMAEYCVFRSRAFPVALQEPNELETMLRFNLSEEFDVELPATIALPVVHPVLVDGRMLPHEWIMTSGGELLKTDNTSHGDDHFFPGPTDIAWDLAGAIAEWGLDASATDFLVERYRRAADDDPRKRLPAFLLAYTVFRMGYCKMAAHAVQGSGEEHRLWSAYQHYRAQVASMLPQFMAEAQPEKAPRKPEANVASPALNFPLPNEA